eukprot:4048089-Pleurochrysis_carterae.AAC.1
METRAWVGASLGRSVSTPGAYHSWVPSERKVILTSELKRQTATQPSPPACRPRKPCPTNLTQSRGRSLCAPIVRLHSPQNECSSCSRVRLHAPTKSQPSSDVLDLTKTVLITTRTPGGGLARYPARLRVLAAFATMRRRRLRRRTRITALLDVLGSSPLHVEGAERRPFARATTHWARPTWLPRELH